MKIQYVADDGTVFDTLGECQEHESDTPLKKLMQLIEDSCPRTCDNEGNCRIEEENLLNFLIFRWQDIKEIMEPDS